MQNIDINELFGIKEEGSHGLLLLKKRNFEEFLKIISIGQIDVLNQLNERLKLFPPDNPDDFPKWIKHCLKRLGILQKKFCIENDLSETHFSRYLNNQTKQEFKDIQKVVTVIKQKLNESKLIDL